MKKPLIHKWTRRSRERGVTMVLVALAMIAIIAMAALSIDVLTLYLAKLEAQRAADEAALASAKVIALSGITGDPTNITSNWSPICGGSTSAASMAAQAVAQQNEIGGVAVPTSAVIVTYSAGNGTGISQSTNCVDLATTTAFGINPLVTVKLTRTNLPNFFSRIWGNTGTNISASATAEAFNPSASGNQGNQNSAGPLTPVQPRCVKPWVVANRDPLNPSPVGGLYCDESGQPSCAKIVNLPDGSIVHPGISTGGTGANGIIGETFWLVADCKHDPNNCTLRTTALQANYTNSLYAANMEAPPNLLFLPGQVTTIPTAVPSSCSSGGAYETAIVGCDQPTNYSCGVPASANPPVPNAVDLSNNPNPANVDAAACLIYQGNTGDSSSSSGQDYFGTFGAPATYPFQILAGSSTPLGKSGLNGTTVSVSPSIVSLPIYDDTDGSVTLTSGGTSNVTFVGFLQVFINAFDSKGNLNVTVLNVTGCSNGSPNPVGSSLISNSPLVVRLITPP
jgi:Flp pilus assembly protein TadG